MTMRSAEEVGALAEGPPRMWEVEGARVGGGATNSKRSSRKKRSSRATE